MRKLAKYEGDKCRATKDNYDVDIMIEISDRNSLKKLIKSLERGKCIKCKQDGEVGVSTRCNLSVSVDREVVGKIGKG